MVGLDGGVERFKIFFQGLLVFAVLSDDIFESQDERLVKLVVDAGRG
jgi:hypothetical protein